MSRFAALMDKDHWTAEDLDGLIEDGLVWTRALHPSLFKGKEMASNLSYPLLTKHLDERLSPLIEQGGELPHILARMASDCREHLKRYQQEEEKFSPDDILRRMRTAVEQPLFVKSVRGNYRAAIVDEFQDTDPLQWAIFSRLFLPLDMTWNGNIYLVGDPKQSIYSFRQADIYTYLSAAAAIGTENSLTLSVNYRSQSSLVAALNLLFSKEHLPSFIPLPKHASELAYHPVTAVKEGPILDESRGAVHFILADCSTLKKMSIQQLEQEIYFPFITSEISRLNNDKELSFSQFAVLVRDRNQARRLCDGFKRQGIPFINQRGTSLAQSPALQTFIDLIQALLHPRHRGRGLAVFAGPLFGWTKEELLHVEWSEFIPITLHQLGISLREKGFSILFNDLLHTQIKPNGCTVMHQLLSQKEGIDFYHDFQQLADCIADHESLEWHTLEEIIPFLDQFQQWELNDDERSRRFEDPNKEGVKVLTLHSSKGLEFEVVFALGLVNRYEIKDELIPVESQGKITLTPYEEHSEVYRLHCEECDSEKMRQLYVALTRAKSQLYIPAAIHCPSKHLKWGEASPIDLFLARLLQPPATYEALYERLRNQTVNNLIDFIEGPGRGHALTYSMHQGAIGPSTNPSPRAVSIPCLQHPPVVTVPGKQIYISSFTSLSHRHDKSIDFEPLEWNVPSDLGSVIKNVHTLPASSETGTMIHRILEKISFNDFEPVHTVEQAIPIIRPHLLQSHFLEWEGPIAQLIFHALKAKLPSLPTTFSFAHLKAGEHYKEMSFLYPYAKEHPFEYLPAADGLVKGVFDLLFFHGGRYYLVDWKTNWLGPDQDSYETNLLHRAMVENTYFLQGSIYATAIERYLKLVDQRPFEECFGGIFYLFLRGMCQGQSDGVYHFFPEIYSP